MRPKMGWWRWTAALCSLATLVVFGGILIDSSDSGSILVRIGFAVLAAAGSTLVGVGIVKRDGHPASSMMVALGMVPAFGLIMFFWFPPIALTGILAIVVAGFAANDYFRTAGATSEA
jgi:hypothetical protein